MRRRAAVPLLALATCVGLAGGAAEAAAQVGPGEEAPEECELVDSRAVRSIAAGQGNRITYVGLPRIRCRDGTRLEADSAVVFEATALTQLIGNVFFDDPESRLTAERANYFENQRRLRAWDDPVLVDKANRSVIRGDSLLLLRPGPTRQTGELTVTGGRPHATLYPEWAEDTVLPGPDVEPPVEPYEIDADRLFFRGLEYMLATGDVVVERGDSLNAFADTLEFLRDRSQMELREAARIVRVDMSLEGRSVSLFLPDDEIREVTAREEAVLVGEDLRLDARTIRLFFEAQELERLVAVGTSAADEEVETAADEEVETAPAEGAPDEEIAAAEPSGPAAAPAPPAPAGRAVAVTEEYVLVSDSIDVRSPGGELERLTAVGRARAEGSSRERPNAPGTPEILARDWLEGDTVVAFFEPVPPAAVEGPVADMPVADVGADDAPVDDAPADDAAGDDVPTDDAPLDDAPADDAPADAERSYRLDELIATGNARSLYRVEPSDEEFEPGRDLPSASYVVGRSIRIVLENDEVARLEVEGLSRGVHLEPRERAAAPSPESEEEGALDGEADGGEPDGEAP